MGTDCYTPVNGGDVMSKSLAIVCTVALLSSAGSHALPLNADTFTPEGILSGSEMTEAACRRHDDTAVWVDVEGRGECLRYFHHGLKATSAMVHVWFHGDMMKEIPDGPPLWSYRKWTPDRVQGIASRQGRKFGTPFIFATRPGTLGSSGYHLNRRENRNTMIVVHAIEAIKRRHQIDRFTLFGQSGGGHLVAALLAFRDDIECAVITSGVVSVRARRTVRPWLDQNKPV